VIIVVLPNGFVLPVFSKLRSAIQHSLNNSLELGLTHNEQESNADFDCSSKGFPKKNASEANTITLKDSNQQLPSEVVALLHLIC